MPASPLLCAIYNVDFGVLNQYWTVLLRAAGTTAYISIVAFACSMPLALGAVFIRRSRRRTVRILTVAYVEVFRNTPLLVVVYVLYFDLPSLHLTFGPYTCGIAALTLCSSAYFIEIFRGGLNAVSSGQYDAAASLGMSRAQANVTIVIPQLLRISYPAIGNQLNGIILGSSLVSVVGINDITQVSYNIGAQTFRYIEVFVAAGVLYFLATHAVSYVWRQGGRRLRQGTSVL